MKRKHGPELQLPGKLSSFQKVVRDVRNSTLASVDLSYIHIGDRGALTLASVIGKSKSLISVDLSWNGIGDEGVKALAPVIGESKSLTSVNLWGNYIGDEGATALAHAIVKSKSLASVNLRENSIDSDGVKALVSAIHRSTSLRCVEWTDRWWNTDKNILVAYKNNVRLTKRLLSLLPLFLNPVLKEPWLTRGIVEYVTGGLNANVVIKH